MRRATRPPPRPLAPGRLGAREGAHLRGSPVPRGRRRLSLLGRVAKSAAALDPGRRWAETAREISLRHLHRSSFSGAASGLEVAETLEVLVGKQAQTLAPARDPNT